MGPIMQERTASTALKRVVSREKIRTKNTENSVPGPSSKKGNKTKKAVGQMKNAPPGPAQEKDTATAMHRGSQSKGARVKSRTVNNTSKVSSPEEEGDLRPPLRKHSYTHRKEEKREHQRLSQCSSDPLQSRGAMGKNRRALSLPLCPISGLRQLQAHPLSHSPAPTPEALQQHYNTKEDDTDSASDLSDSERLPVLPSPCTPCTPPHLNLRAEIINTNDFPPDIPGPHGTVGGDEDGDEKPTYCYPEFLPPPFNSWSLRQLAVFLHTEGRGAPRPKPVGPLEKYLERLLQLEWLQIQTVQAENSRPAGSRPRPQGFPSSTAPHPPRPHTAPPSRLNSPKGLRHSQRAFPFTPVNNPPSPASAAAQHQLSRFPVCPHCHIRYPLCNGSCSAYAYQRHSRLSPLLERKPRPGATAKRSSSETRATSNEGRSPGAPGGSVGGAQTPVSPSAGRSHLKHMQAPGNSRKQAQEPSSSQSCRGQARRSRIRANSETDVKKDPSGSKAAGPEKRVLAAGKKELGASRREEKDWQRAEAGGQTSKTTVKRALKEPSSLPKTPLITTAALDRLREASLPYHAIGPPTTINHSLSTAVTPGSWCSLEVSIQVLTRFYPAELPRPDGIGRWYGTVWY